MCTNCVQIKIVSKIKETANRLQMPIYSCFLLVEGDGFEPSKSIDNRFTVCPLWPLGNPSVLTIYGDLEGFRTLDLQRDRLAF